MQLLKVLDPKILNRKHFKLNPIKEVRLMAQAIMKNVNDINAFHLEVIVPRFIHYQIGSKSYFEILATIFTRDIDKMDFKTKARMMYWFALTDIDQSYIFKSVLKICQSYSEAFLNLDLN